MEINGTGYEPEIAERMAEELQNGDSEWTYKVRHDPRGVGYSFIDIYDEDGFLLGQL